MKLLLILIWITSIVQFTTQTVLVGEQWNKRSENFEPIPGLLTYEEARRKIILQTRQHETHNFNGEPLNVTYYEELGFFQYYDNDTKVSGICGEIWTTLSHSLNFTLVLSKSNERSAGEAYKNGTYSGILELARLNRTDIVPKTVVYITRLNAFEFSPQFWINSQRIFVHGQWKRNRAWMFNLLTMEVWGFIIAFIVTLSLASIVTQRILIRQVEREVESEGYFHHVFYTFSTFCSQVNMSDKTGSGSRLLNLTITIFAFLTLIAYNSRLIHSMAEESFEAPFNDLETLLENTKFVLVVLDGSTAYLALISAFTAPIFGRIVQARRYTVVSNINELYDKVCNYPDKYVIFDSEEAFAVRGERECEIIPVGIPYYSLPAASGVTRRVNYRKSLFIGIMKLREFGILDLLKKRYMMSSNRKKVIRRVKSRAIDMDHVAIIFGIFCLGIVVSIIMCVVENIIFALKERKNIKSLAKTVTRVRKTMFINSSLHYSVGLTNME